MQRDRDDDWADIVKAARLKAAGKTQIAIATELRFTASKVSRLIQRAEAAKILVSQVIPPPLTDLEEQLKAFIPSKVTVSVVPDGPEKNTANLGAAGAKQVMSAIEAVSAELPVSEHINISITSGTTVFQVISDLLDEIAKRQASADRDLWIRHQLHIYPAVLFGDHELYHRYPHTMVAYFAMLGKRYNLKTPDNDGDLINGHALQLPENFYLDENASLRAVFLQNPAVDKLIGKIKNSHIFVLGAGPTSDKEYADRIVPQLQMQCHRDDILQVLYTPLGVDGLPSQENSNKIVGVTVTHLRSKLVLDSCRPHVILISGGNKTDALQRIIKHPCYNVLVTDAGVVKEAKRRNADHS